MSNIIRPFIIIIAVFIVADANDDDTRYAETKEEGDEPSNQQLHFTTTLG